MIKKILALLTASAMLLTGCSLQDAVDNSTSQTPATTEISTTATVTDEPDITIEPITEISTVSTTDSFIENPLILRNTEYIESLGFNSLDDTEFHDFIEDAVYSDLVTQLNSEKFFVENVEAVYISKEYLDEVSYNSLENLYFGYKLSELDQAFQGEKYIFTLNENGQTDVVPFEEYDDTYEKVVRNVAIGTGVILLCVTVSVVTGGVGATAVSMIFATSAKAGAIGALTGGALDGAVTFASEYAQTGNPQEALKKSTLAASEGYMVGAITGAISGGVGETIGLKKASLNGLSMNDAAKIQKESKLPLEIIKNFHSKEEADVIIKAGLNVKKVNGAKALVREIDWDLVDEKGTSNIQKVLKGNAPIGPDGKPLHLHHIGQRTDTPLAILTQTEHQANSKILHYADKGKDITDAAWNEQRKKFWEELLKLEKGITK